jgi:hypothetical protein
MIEADTAATSIADAIVAMSDDDHHDAAERGAGCDDESDRRFARAQRRFTAP